MPDETPEEKEAREKLEREEAEKKKKDEEREKRSGVPDLKRVAELEAKLKKVETEHSSQQSLIGELKEQLSNVQKLISEGKKDKHVKNVLDEIAEFLGL